MYFVPNTNKQIKDQPLEVLIVDTTECAQFPEVTPATYYVVFCFTILLHWYQSEIKVQNVHLIHYN